MSTFGRIFRVTTSGESHCRGITAIVDGVPPCMQLTEADIQPQLTRRRPGQSKLTTPRDEKDQVTIMSGTERGMTLGTPIALFVPNQNIRPGDYNAQKGSSDMNNIPRPGHADYTYQAKYGVRASSGGGRSSARETIGRVAAGAIAEKWLRSQYATEVTAFVSAIGTVQMPEKHARHPSGRAWTRAEIDENGRLLVLRKPGRGASTGGEANTSGWRRVLRAEVADDAARALLQAELDAADEEIFVEQGLHQKGRDADARTPAYLDVAGNVYGRNGDRISASDTPTDLEAWKTDDLLHVRCPHTPSACRMSSLCREVKADDNSIGGVATGVCTNMPVGLGEPCFDKLPAVMSHAMLSLPATKGFEFGSGFEGTKLRGSQHNDVFEADESGSGLLRTASNNAGGTLGGISNGADFTYKVAFKPVSTIAKGQHTATFDGKKAFLESRGRHDPCVLPRTPPLLEAMAAIVLADATMVQLTRSAVAGPVCSLATEARHRGGGICAKRAAADSSSRSSSTSSSESNKKARTGGAPPLIPVKKP